MLRKLAKFAAIGVITVLSVVATSDDASAGNRGRWNGGYRGVPAGRYYVAHESIAGTVAVTTQAIAHPIMALGTTEIAITVIPITGTGTTTTVLREQVLQQPVLRERILQRWL